MNTAYLFEVDLYRVRVDGTKSHTKAQVVATGSQETRARRRLINGAHNSGLLVRNVTLLAKEPTK